MVITQIMSRLKLSLSISLVALFGLKSAGVAQDAPSIQPLSVSQASKLIRLPLIRQATEYTCGTAAVLSVLAYFGDSYFEDALAKQLATNSRTGTYYKRIIEFGRAHGYSVQADSAMTVDALKQFIDEGTPVICLIQAWAGKTVDYGSDVKDGHYVVAVGYDSQNIYFMDPWSLGNLTYLSYGELLSRWHDVQKGTRIEHLGIAIRKDKPALDMQAVRKMQ
jgi:predicted double-glycine peptidase